MLIVSLLTTYAVSDLLSNYYHVSLYYLVSSIFMAIMLFAWIRCLTKKILSPYFADEIIEEKERQFK